MAKKKGRKKRWIIITIIAVVILFLAFGRGKKEHLTSVTVEKVQTRDITSTVSATGKVYPELELTITSEVSGEITSIPVKEGQFVHKGDVLVTIDPDTLESQVRQQEAALEANKAQANRTLVELERARKVFNDQKGLFDEGFISADSLNEYESNLKSLEASYAASLASIRQQEMSLAEANEDLSKTTIYASMDGTITSISMEEGERVVGVGQFDGTEIMRLANMNVMEVRIDVAETDIVNVKVDDPAVIFVDAISNEEFSGVVTEIASSGTSANTGTAEQTTTFEVRIRVDGLDKRLRPGMTATSDISTETVTGVLAVPIQCVTVREKKAIAEALGRDLSDEVKDLAYAEGAQEGQQKGPQGKANRKDREKLQRIVFVVVGDHVEFREVETGIADTAWMEIKGGLKEDETIVSGSYSAITRELGHMTKVQTPNNGNNGAGEAK